MDREDQVAKPSEEDRQARFVSRRDFLKLAGVTGALVGIGGGLGGLVAGCGGETTTSTTAAAGTATTAAGGTETTGGVDTTVSASVETGKLFRVGYPSPQTGSIAPFGAPDAYCAGRWKEFIGDGIVCGDGKKHPVEILVRDTQSDTNRVAQVTGELIMNDKVSLIVASSSPDTVCPSADQAEALETPYISVDCPMETFWVGRGKDPTKDVFKWTFNAFWCLYQHADAFIEIWDKIPSNKTIGVMFPNDADGNGDRTIWPGRLESRGYKLVDGGAYQNMSEDFTSQVALFKKDAAEIVFGDMIPPDFVNFWKQCIQQDYRPKIPSMAKALLFPEAVEAAGPIAAGFLGDCCWCRDWPFKSSLTGETCDQLAADFETKLKREWTQPVGMHYPLGEWLVDILKRCKNLEDKNEIVNTIKATHIETINGPIHFDEPVKPYDQGGKHIYENGYIFPFAIGEWVPGTVTGVKYPFDFVTIDSSIAPEVGINKPYMPPSEINPAYKEG